MDTLAWWQRGVVYEIYPRSFQDTDGTGTGDLPGIVRRLDHLVWLGVDALWICPVYPSPMADFGYDIADYCDIDPTFGSLDDMDTLIAQAHARGLKIILDYVPNHTSDRHPWFVDSRRGRESARRDWYLWRDAAPGGTLPNNWLSNFGGPAWTWDAASEQYYYHSFLPSQPDLNWRNPHLRSAMFDVLRFWMRRGVDGVRIDVLWMLIKDDLFRDNPPNPDYVPGGSAHDRLLPVYTTDRPEMAELVVALRTVLDEYPDRVMIAELYLPFDRLVTYYGRRLDGAQLPFNFQLLLMREWTAQSIACLVRQYETALPPGAWPNWVLGNHDRSRITSRIGAAQARVAACLLLTLRGTPTIYMGDELGMLDTPITPASVRDPAELREPARGLGRDPERTPFPWDSGAGAGFTTGVPWLPIGDDTPLSLQRDDPHSMVHLYRSLLALRRHHVALQAGAIERVEAHGAVLSFRRVSDTELLLILANTGRLPACITADPAKILLSTYADRVGERTGESINLRADEAIVLRL